MSMLVIPLIDKMNDLFKVLLWSCPRIYRRISISTQYINSISLLFTVLDIETNIKCSMQFYSFYSGFVVFVVVLIHMAVFIFIYNLHCSLSFLRCFSNFSISTRLALLFSYACIGPANTNHPLRKTNTGADLRVLLHYSNDIKLIPHNWTFLHWPRWHCGYGCTLRYNYSWFWFGHCALGSGYMGIGRSTNYWQSEYLKPFFFFESYAFFKWAG